MTSYEDREWARVALIATVAGQLAASPTYDVFLQTSIVAHAAKLVELAEKQVKARTEHPTP